MIHMNDNDDDESSFDSELGPGFGVDVDPCAADVQAEHIPACQRGQETMSTHVAPVDPFSDPDVRNAFLAGRPRHFFRVPERGPLDVD